MASITFLVIEKNGTIKEQTVKNPDVSMLYKKAGFKTPDGFTCHTEWNIEELNGKSYAISVYGKITGRANQENKFEFPPPIDNTLFFGNCIIINKVDDVITSVTEKEWDTIYDYLNGGFEDLGDEDSEDDEDDEDDDLPRTKTGYVKDDFVVDDEEEDEEEEEEEEDEEEEEEVYVTKSKKSKAKATTKKTAKPKNTKKTANVISVFESLGEGEENYLDCTSELSEEEYIE